MSPVLDDPPPPSEVDDVDAELDATSPPPTELVVDEVLGSVVPLLLEPTTDVVEPAGAPPLPLGSSVAGSGNVHAPAMPNAIPADAIPALTIDLT